MCTYIFRAFEKCAHICFGHFSSVHRIFRSVTMLCTPFVLECSDFSPARSSAPPARPCLATRLAPPSPASPARAVLAQPPPRSAPPSSLPPVFTQSALAASLSLPLPGPSRAATTAPGRILPGPARVIIYHDDASSQACPSQLGQGPGTRVSESG